PTKKLGHPLESVYSALGSCSFSFSLLGRSAAPGPLNGAPCVPDADVRPCYVTLRTLRTLRASSYSRTKLRRLDPGGSLHGAWLSSFVGFVRRRSRLEVFFHE